MSVTIRELREHFFIVSHWVDPNRTADRITYGDPGRQVKKIGTGWVPCWQNLEAGASDGCDLFISHETFFYGEWAPNLDSIDTVWGKRRMEVLEKHDLACINLHDTWDNFPEYGIRDAWRNFLGLTELLDERPYYRPGAGQFAAQNSLALCRVEPQTLGEFAAFVAEQCSTFRSSHGVTFMGDRNARVESAATGVGCHIPGLEMLELGADVLVLTLDRALQTTIRIPLIEMGANLLVVEHGVAEMPGMQSMAEYLRKTFPGVEATFYCEEPEAETVVA